MKIRTLKPEELYESSLISTVAFHGRIENPEERKAKLAEGAGKYTNNDWGAFAEDGTLMAHAINNTFYSNFDGSVIKNGGIGGVSTLPEYRNTGAIRAIFAEMLRAARDAGEIISTLYPFNHSFYRKFGYETAMYATQYLMPVSALRGFKHEGWVKIWHPGETAELFTDLYNKFAKRYNLSLVRDDALMANHVRGEYYKDRRFSYLIGDAEGACAYVVFDDVRQEPQARLSVEDFAWIGPRGLRALLGFLARFSADYHNIAISLPADVDIQKLIEDPHAAEIKGRCGYMARVINAPKLLALMKKPADAKFTISIRDDMLPENGGTWLVDGESVVKTDQAADISVSERALAQLALGVSSLDEALYRKDVTVASNIPVLRRVFTQKPIYISDHF